MYKLCRSLFYSALLTAYGGSLFIVIRILYLLVNQQDLSHLMGETITASLVCFTICAVGMYELESAFEELNKPAKPDGKDESGSQEGDNSPKE